MFGFLTDAIVKNIQTQYEVKVNDDRSPKLNAQIAPDGNWNFMKGVLSSDCKSIFPAGLRIFKNVASYRKWQIHNAEVKSAFLETGQTNRDVYGGLP